MLKRLCFAMVMCLCLTAVSFGQKDTPRETNDNIVVPWDPFQRIERERQQKEVAGKLFEAIQNSERAREKEASTNDALSKADPNSAQAEKLTQEAAKASYERAKAELAEKLIEKEASKIGAVIEARENKSPTVKEASTKNEPREVKTKETPEKREARETKEAADRWKEHDERQQKSNDRRP